MALSLVLVLFLTLLIQTVHSAGHEFERFQFPSSPQGAARPTASSGATPSRVSEHTVRVQAPGMIPEYTGHNVDPRASAHFFLSLSQMYNEYKSVYVAPPSVVEHVPYGSQMVEEEEEERVAVPQAELPEPWGEATAPPAPPVQPVIVSTPKPVEYYEINYCDRNEFPDETLAQYSLQRIEYFIFNTSCSPIFFQCSIGQTFFLRCPSDDEAFDISTVNCNFKNSVKYCVEYDHVLHCSIQDTCGENEFACCASPQKCIPLEQRCDGKMDCADGDEENNCPSCKRDEFACVKSGTCIPATMRCDGHVDDCQDGSNLDELGCSRNETCLGKFVCAQSRGGPSCVEYERHCDGTRDCENGEDEVNCKLHEAKYLLCENQKESVTKAQWCDGKPDCLDASDERYCH